MKDCCVLCESINSLRDLKIHSNSPRCPQIHEVVPVYGCEFQCEYCNALGQEEGRQFIPVQIDTGYPEFLENEIVSAMKNNNFPYYYFSPKTDCFQRPLLDTKITLKIIQLFNKYECEYILVSKGVPNEEVFEEMKKSGNRCQMIITYAMPTEEFREKLEKGAATNQERYEFAKQCIENGIKTVIILEPILPLENQDFVEHIMKEFTDIGINHFALDFARISEESLNRITEIIPECKEQLEKIYKDPDADRQAFKTAKGTIVTRTAPSKKYILDRFNYFKEVAKGMGATVSACNSFGFHDFNQEANAVGYECMGIRLKK